MAGLDQTLANVHADYIEPLLMLAEVICLLLSVLLLSVLLLSVLLLSVTLLAGAGSASGSLV